MASHIKTIVLGREDLSSDVYKLTIKRPKDITINAGEFINIYPDNIDHMLGRPISISDFNEDEIVLVIRKVGAETYNFSKLDKGDEIVLSKPLGNGYEKALNRREKKLEDYEKVILLGGGIGIAPLVRINKELNEKGIDREIFLGYKDASENTFLKEDMSLKEGKTHVYTEDGSIGKKGFPVDDVKNEMKDKKILLIACGPIQMFRSMKNSLIEKASDMLFSMEGRMGCGYGACVGCNIITTMGSKKVCKDGPFFFADEIIFKEGLQSKRIIRKKANYDDIDLSVELFGEKLKNPLMPASGTFSYEDTKCFYNPDLLGAIVTKGVSFEPWSGNPLPRIGEVNRGMLNCVGLENMGAKHFKEVKWPVLSKSKAPVIINVAGHKIEEYERVIEELNELKPFAFEVNISCPNIDKGGISIGIDEKECYNLIKRLRKITNSKLLVKLSPNVSDITKIGKAAIRGGADGLSLINTLVGTKIDVRTGKKILSRGNGGFSGPAIKPVAVRMVYELREVTSLPIIGMGGISTGEDVAEFIMAGADACAVGTSALVEADAIPRIIEELKEYMKEMGFKTIKDIRNYYLENL